MIGSIIVAERPLVIGEQIANMAKLNKSLLPKLSDGLPDEVSSPTTDQAIGQRVRNLRKMRGWTQQDLANAVGVTGVYISDLERGKRRWQAERIADVAHVLNVSPALLQDPSIPLDRLEKISLIVGQLANLPEDKLEAIELVLDRFLS